MAIIRVNNIKLYGKHGWAPEEKLLGQKFEIDVEITADITDAIQNDDLEKTVDYSLVYSNIKEIFTEKNYHLIEAVGDTIANNILEMDRVNSVTVRIRKPHAPIDGVFDNVEVEITRSNNK
ncbi:MAG: dihydroneopterin aldolase [Candidatus Marinimicrobia bacterium]|nr:dihydroneopterin aldolase [Candidatus Neomarinimicrobiota bacterium]MBL7023606.1 dihydroneopterin aldolase [Candidatus Neomarinimicrobiota bacterium]MBL7109896.1 dihydroneopterin aldolase [Candidatus Neomarinimicrobiota bacterium]